MLQQALAEQGLGTVSDLIDVQSFEPLAPYLQRLLADYQRSHSLEMSGAARAALGRLIRNTLEIATARGIAVPSHNDVEAAVARAEELQEEKRRSDGKQGDHAGNLNARSFAPKAQTVRRTGTSRSPNTVRSKSPGAQHDEGRHTPAAQESCPETIGTTPKNGSEIPTSKPQSSSTQRKLPRPQQGAKQRTGPSKAS